MSAELARPAFYLVKSLGFFVALLEGIDEEGAPDSGRLPVIAYLCQNVSTGELLVVDREDLGEVEHCIIVAMNAPLSESERISVCEACGHETTCSTWTSKGAQV